MVNKMITKTEGIEGFKSKIESDLIMQHRFLSILYNDLISGIRHGFFKYEIECEITTGKKRQITYRAGKSHRFVISEQETDKF